MSSSPPATPTRASSRRLAIRALVILVTITVVGTLASGSYGFTRTAPYVGNWLGRGHVQGMHGSVAIEIYLTLNHSPLGITGAGRVCGLPSSPENDAATSTLYIFPVTVEGHIFDEATSFTMYSYEQEILPPEFNVHSTLEQEKLVLSSAPEQHLSLTMLHGTLGDFYFTCDGLRFSERT